MKEIKEITIRVIIGVIFCVGAILIIRYFDCSPFDQGLWGGSFGQMAQYVTGDIIKSKERKRITSQLRELSKEL